jgi:hypothetical protein
MTVIVMSHLFIGFISFTLKRIQILEDIQRLSSGHPPLVSTSLAEAILRVVSSLTRCF